MAEHGGKAPPPKKGADKKSGGGFWSFLGDVLSNVNVRFKASNPTDPAERMQPVHDERKEAYEETIYRKTEGAEGTAPAERLERGRKTIARSIDNRMGAQGTPKAPPAGGGAPLSRDVRARMEPRLGSDLSGVRVHTSGDSAAAAEDVSAKAFTVGSDVHFGSGQYQPGTKEGDRLLAHELTHVVQGQRSGIQRKAGAPVNDDAALEREADTAGAKAMHGEHEVSHPDEPAEKEADSVADHVADDLHGGGAHAGQDKQDKKSKKDPSDSKKDAAGGGKDGAGKAAGPDGAEAKGGKKVEHGNGAPGASAASGSATHGAQPATAHDGGAATNSAAPDNKSGGGAGAAPAASQSAAAEAAKSDGSNAPNPGGGADVKQQAPAVGAKRESITQSYAGVGRKILRAQAPRAQAPRRPPAAPGPAQAGAQTPAAAEAPKAPKALSLSPINVEAARPEFADAFAALPASGKVPGVQGGGDPAQVADAIVKAHPNAKMDPAGTLTLPSVDAGAVGGAASPQQAASLIAQQTGVPTVTMSVKEDAVDFEVQINPVTAAGSVRPKSPSERADFKKGLGKLDSTVVALITGIIDERKIRYMRAKDWADATEKLKTEERIKPILEKPMLLDHAFGRATHAAGVTELNAALKASGSKPLSKVAAGDKLSHWKAMIHDEVGALGGIAAALREQLFNSSKAAAAATTMNKCFTEKLKLGEKEEHDWYRPEGIKPLMVDGKAAIQYKNAQSNGEFVVKFSDDDMVESITGTNLSLKEPGTRGATGQAGRAVPNAGLESSHLIADRFRGSGYKRSCNLVATSAQYNDPMMKNVEDRIETYIIDNSIDEFTMDVAVKWMDLNDAALWPAVERQFPDITKPELKDLKAELKAYAASLKSQSPNLKRVKSTSYEVTGTKNTAGGKVNAKPFKERLGTDVWMGMASAPAP